jgi:hypothetical protein
MMRHAPIVIASAMLLLGGCNQSAPSNSAASAENAASAESPKEVTTTAAPIGIKPGQWEYTSEVLDVQATGMPPQAVAMMKSGPHSVTACVTPEKAKVGVREMMQRNGKSDCSFDKYEFGGGKVAFEMSCTMPGGKMVTKSTGSYSATSYDMTGEGTMTSSTEGPQHGPMSMTMKTHNSGKWVGECTGKEDAK